jgi:membrane-associated phospholipid phosphatase
MLRRPTTALLAAAWCAALAFATWAAAFHVDLAQRADAGALHGFTRLAGTRFAEVADFVASTANPLPYAVLTSVLAFVALRSRGLRGAVLVLGILAAANLTTQFLKPALAAPRAYLEAGDAVGAASWPSGHATASMALALCAVLVVPPSWRALVAVAGAAYAMLVSYSVVLLTWHFPSDVVGGFAVAGCATCLGVAALRAVEGRRPAPAPEAASGGVLIAAGTVALAFGGTIAAARVLVDLPDRELQIAFVAGVAGIAALALVLAAGLLVALRR